MVTESEVVRAKPEGVGESDSVRTGAAKGLRAKGALNDEGRSGFFSAADDGCQCSLRGKSGWGCVERLGSVRRTLLGRNIVPQFHGFVAIGPAPTVGHESRLPSSVLTVS